MPLSEDLSGLPTSLPTDLVADWNKVIQGVLSHAASTGPDLNRVLAAAPDFAVCPAFCSAARRWSQSRATPMRPR
jgi:hypothetical protein